MYEMLLIMYVNGVLDDEGLDRAVNPKKWITAEQAAQIRTIAGVVNG